MSRRPALPILSVIAPLSLLCSLPGCFSAEASRPGVRTLRYSNSSDIQSLDPAIAYDTVSWPLVRLLYNGLIQYDDNLRPTAWMAKSFEVSPDARVFRFVLRKGIKFANGREMEASDCVYTLERVLNSKTASPGEAFFRNIVGAREFQAGTAKRVSGLRAPRKYLLEIELVNPDISFLSVMSLPFTYVVAREAVEQHGEDFYRNPMGTGPMVLKEWTRGSRIVMERNPLYWDPPYPRADRFELMMGGDEMMRLMMFERGDLDLFDPIPGPDFPRMTTHPKWKPMVTRLNQIATMYLSMNNEMEPFNNRKVRQAMNYALNREAILQLIHGQGIPARGVLPPDMPGFNPKVSGYSYDPARAKRLLAEAGYPDGFQVTLWCRAELAEEDRIALLMQSQFAQVGVKVDLHTVPFPVWDEAVSRRGNVKFAYSGWFMDYPDPYNFLDVLLNGKKIVGVHCNNYAFYRNPEVDRLLARAARETDRERRLGMYGRIDALVTEDAPWVFMYYPSRHFLHQPWVTNYSNHLIWPYRFERLGVRS